MELDREEGFLAVHDTLVRAVVSIGKGWLPVRRERVVVHRITVVLGRDHHTA